MDEDDDVIRAYGDLQLALNPLPPGLDWDYFQQDSWKDDAAELGDSPLMEESPAIDAVYDWGNPLIVEGDPMVGNGHVPMGRHSWDNVSVRACLPQPCIPADRWPPRYPLRAPAYPPGPGPKPCPPRPCPQVKLPPGGWTTSLPHVGAAGGFEEDVEICERQPEVPTATVAGGQRFAHLERQLRMRGVRNPAALAAWIGRRKYGARRFAQMAAAGRRAAR